MTLRLKLWKTKNNDFKNAHNISLTIEDITNLIVAFCDIAIKTNNLLKQ